MDTEIENSDARPGASLAQRLADELERDILKGEFAPAARLDETLLAARFGVSRTPIREALGQLVSAGLLERRPRRGVIVASVSSDRLVEMFEVMAELESLAARLAARRLTEEDAAMIRKTHAACGLAVDAGDKDGYYYENERFHQAIYAASHSDFLMDQCLALRRRLKPYRRMQLDARNRMASSFAEHEAIVAAILDQKDEEAETLLRNHILIQNERFSDLMAALKRKPVSAL